MSDLTAFSYDPKKHQLYDEPEKTAAPATSKRSGMSAFLDPVGYVTDNVIKPFAERLPAATKRGLNTAGQAASDLVGQNDSPNAMYDAYRNTMGLYGLNLPSAEDASGRFEAGAQAAREEENRLLGQYEDGSVPYYSSQLSGSAPLLAGTALVGAVNPAAGASVLFGGASADAYSGARADGASYQDAATVGVGSGAIEAITEMPVLKALKLGAKPVFSGVSKFVDKVLETKVGRVGSVMAAEAGSELIANPSQMALEEGVLDKDYTTEDYMRAARDSVVLGAAMGGGMYGLTKPIRAYQQYQADQQNEALRRLNAVLGDGVDLQTGENAQAAVADQLIAQNDPISFEESTYEEHQRSVNDVLSQAGIGEEQFAEAAGQVDYLGSQNAAAQAEAQQAELADQENEKQAIVEQLNAPEVEAAALDRSSKKLVIDAAHKSGDIGAIAKAYEQSGDDPFIEDEAEFDRLAPREAEKLRGVFKRAHKAMPWFAKTLSVLSDGLELPPMLAPLKGGKRTVQKIQADYQGLSSGLKDAIRATIQVSSFDELNSTLENIGASLNIQKGGFRNFLDPMMPSPAQGYRDVKMNFVTPNGVVGELQVNFPEMLEAKKTAHKLYEVQRSIQAKATNEGRLPNAEEKAKMASLDEQQRAIYGAAWDVILAKSAGASGNLATQSASDISTPSSSALSSDSISMGGSDTNTSPPPPSGSASSTAGKAGSEASKPTDSQRTGLAPASDDKSLMKATGESPENAGTVSGTQSVPDSSTLSSRSALSKGEISNEINNVKRRLPNVKIRLVDSFDEVGVSDDGVTTAVYASGEIVIHSGRVASAKALQRDLAHEGTHAGLRALFPNVGDYRAMMTQVFEFARANPNTAAGMYLLRLMDPANGYVTPSGTLTDPSDDGFAVVLGDEVLAHLSENYKQLGVDDRGMVSKVIAAIKKVLRYVYPKADFSDDDVFDLITEAQLALKKVGNNGATRRRRDLEMQSIQRNERKTGVGQLSDAEIAALEADAKKQGLNAEQLKEQAKKVKANYPSGPKGDFSPLELTGLKTASELKEEAIAGDAIIVDGAVDRFKWRQQPYNFHNAGPSEKTDANEDPKARAGRVAKMAKLVVTDLRAVVARAAAGDRNAKAIIDASGWYAEMRTRLRKEFGGLGDLFADLLGATSPNTPVRTNWDFSIDALQSALEGRLDSQIDAFAKGVADIEQMEAQLASMMASRTGTKKSVLEDPQYKATQAAITARKAELTEKVVNTVTRRGTNAKGGEVKYGINNYGVLKALVGAWRNMSAGAAPKAVNFSGNLIGYSRKATIDVWAARYLRGLAQRAINKDFKVVPPPAEKGVSGKVLEDGKVGLEFGFGQDVFEQASALLRKSGMAEFADTQADDLQAVVWFLEKEKWATNNWTTKTGEGGSFELEANYAGEPNRQRIAELRRIVSSSVPKAVQGNVAKTEAYEAKRAEAREELKSLEGEVDSFQGGLSIAMSESTQGFDFVPDDATMADVSSTLRERAFEQEGMLAAKVESTEGRYGNDSERSFDIELVARRGTNVAGVFTDMLKIARHYNQDAVFLSRKVHRDADIDLINHNVGVEVYFQNKLNGDSPLLDQVLSAVKASQGEYAGVTLIAAPTLGSAKNDGKLGDIVGVRVQDIPEFAARYGDDSLAGKTAEQWADYHSTKINEMQELAETIKGIVGVSDALQLVYDTDVRFSHEYDETIRAYEDGAGQVDRKAWSGRSRDEGVAAAVRQSAEGGAPQSDGRDPRKPARQLLGRNEIRRSRSNAAGGGRNRGSAEQTVSGSVTPWNDRPVQQGALTLDVVHYSTSSKLKSINGKKYGTNHKGAEWQRLSNIEFYGLEKRMGKLLNRAYFYVRGGKLAESGGETMVGSNPYFQTLGNIYDETNDPLNLGRKVSIYQESWRQKNEFELAVINAGFDGYVSKFGNGDRAVVLLGTKPVEVRRSRMINVDGIDRPTENSKGQQIHETEEGIRNFWRWFGDSKVVDEQGRPVVQYHGTSVEEDFYEFNPSPYKTTWVSNTKVASAYSNGGERPRVIPVYVKSENPYIANFDMNDEVDVAMSKGLSEIIEKIIELNGEAAEFFANVEFEEAWQLVNHIEFKQGLISLGYDSIFIKESSFRSDDTIGVFDNSYLKSAIGNNGDFSESPDIRRSRSLATKEAFEARVDELFAGAKANRMGIKVLDKSDILDLIGMGKFPVVLAEAHAITDKAHPEITAEDWKKIPEWLDDPLLVLERPDGNLTILTKQLRNGHPMIIGMNPRGESDRNSALHVLITSYAKEEGKRIPIMERIRKGELRYIDLKKSLEISRGAGLQLPRGGDELRGYPHRVYTKNDLVKYQNGELRRSRGAFSANGRTYPATLPSGDLSTPEGVKAYSKRVIDIRPSPESLPEEPWAYFEKTDDAVLVPLDKVITTESDDDKGGRIAPKRFLAAYDGAIPKREPITVSENSDGTYSVIDGNGSANAFKAAGWQKIPVEVRRSRGVTDSPEFKQWFGESVVVNEDGTPKMVYHATKDGAQFDAFDTKRSELGSHFGTEDQADTILRTGWNTRLLEPFYLRAENPYRLNDAGLFTPDRVIQQLMEANELSEAKYNELSAMGGKGGIEGIQNFLKSLGYDSIVYLNRHEISKKNGGLSVFPDENDYTVETIGEGKVIARFETEEEAGNYIDELNDEEYAELTGAEDSYIVFDPQQVKSATDNNGEFSEAPEFRRKRTPIETAFTHYTMPTEDYQQAYADAQGRVIDKYIAALKASGRKFRRNFQDDLNPLKHIEDAIKAGGVYDDGLMNAYQRAELYYGRTGNKIKKFREELVDPLVHELGKHADITMADLELYLYAKFAPVRNRKIYEANIGRRNSNEYLDGKSGMLNADAKQILLDFQNEGKTNRLEAMAQMIYKINEFRTDIALRSGLISQETADEWRSEPTYVPLKGFADGRKSSPQGSGKGFTISGPESWRAKGRNSRAGQIIEHAIAQAELSIVRAEKNMVAQSFVALVAANPNKELWEVKRAKVRVMRDNETGEVLEHSDGTNVIALTFPNDKSPPVFSAKIEGKDVMVMLKGDEGRILADSMKNMGAMNLGKFLSTLRKAMRWLSMARTTLNPEFVITNFARDIQTAMVNLSGEQSAAMARKTFGNIKPAMGAIFRAEKGEKGNGKWDTLYQEFLADGGQTDFGHARAIEDILTDIESELKSADKSVARKGIERTWEYFIAANTAVENSSRLAAYAAAREAGFSRKDAASLGKNLTVNFNRKGAQTGWLNVAYMFSNAAIQGNARFIQYIAKNPQKAVTYFVLPTMAFGLAVSFLNAFMGGEDEDGEDRWAKLSQQEKDRNLVLMYGDKRVKIPVAYTYSLPMALGQRLGDMLMGNTPPTKMLAGMASTIVTSFNPIGNTGAPTLAQPFVEIAKNENFFGDKVRPEQAFEKYPVPDSQKYWENRTAKPYVWIAQGLNEITGGSMAKSGMIDVSPTTLETHVNFWMGGISTFVDKVVDSAVAGTKGEMPAINRIPFVSKVVAQMEDRQITNDYYTFAQQANATIEEREVIQESGEMKEQSPDQQKEYGMSYRLEGAYKRSDKQLKALRKARKVALAKGDQERADELEDRMVEVQSRFNKVYVETYQKLDKPIR